MEKKQNLIKLSLVITTILLCVFGVQSQNINNQSHQEYQEIIDEQKALIANLSQNAVTSRYELLNSYDIMIEELNSLQENQEKLSNIPQYIKEQDQLKLKTEIDNLNLLVTELEEIINQTISNNALLKNSVRYLPELTAELSQQSFKQNWDKDFLLTVDELLQRILLYNLTADQKLTSSVQELIKQVAQLQSLTVNPQEKEILDLLVRHSNVIFRMKPKVEESLQTLLSLPFQEQIENLEVIYTNSYEQAVSTSNIYLFLTYACLIIIVGLIAYLVNNNLASLLQQRRQAEQNLQKSNQELEQRSQELSQLLAQIKTAEEEQRKAKEQIQIRVNQLQTELDPINQGDLTIRATITGDEIGTVANYYNNTLDNLSRLILQAQQVTQTITNTTNINQQEVNRLSEDALLQNKEISTALNQVQKMAQSMVLVAQNAANAENSIKQATKKVKEGDQALNASAERIFALRESTNTAKEQVQKLAKASRKISKAVDLIRKIALQTNVLAVNASIEAARAGEEGMGFTVVAEEVQSLASRSAKTATEIEQLVLEIQGETNKVIKVMENNSQEISAGSQLMKDTRLYLQEVTEASSKIDRLIEDINKVAAEQSSKSQIVTVTMEEVSAIATKTSATATNVSVSFKDLLQATGQLEASINQFKV